jgi:hypothetical protein
MTYKTLKLQQLLKLKNEGQCKRFVEAIANADFKAFGDIRNLLFERELGTNILTDLIEKP